MNSQVKKVMLITPLASQAFGGEAILPVHYFKRLPAQGVETFMVVHERTKKELEQLFPEHLDHITFIEDTWLHKLLYRCSRLLPQRIAGFTFIFAIDLLTEYAQLRHARRLIREEGIDLVHVPIRVSPRCPSLICALDVPVVFGPLNGGMSFPPGFTHMQKNSEKAFMRFARYFANVLNRLLPGKFHATTILVANERTRAALPKTRCRNIVTLVENGVDLALFAPPEKIAQPNTQMPFRFLYLGRLVDWKCVDLLIEAAARLAEAGASFSLDIIGDGEERTAMERQVAALDLQRMVNFHGFIPQKDCPSQLAACDCLVLPSMYECGGAVVLEAMAMGKPVIATDWGGPADYLDKSCGMLISPEGGPQVFVERLAGAMLNMIENPRAAQKMGLAGRAKVAQHFDWAKKAELVVQIFEQSLLNYREEQATVSTAN